MRRVFALTSGFLGLVFLFQSGAGRAGEDKGIIITDKKDKSTVILKKGEILTVKLAGNPTTGYQWVIAKNDSGVLAAQGKGDYLADNKNSVGGGGTLVFRFKGAKTGKVDLKMDYMRPFEKGQPPAKTFKVTVEVK